MAMDDLFKALEMFKSGAKELQTSRAISSANEYVQQVKASEMNDQQKRAELQAVSNQLVGQMASIGTPATTIAQVAGTIGPRTFANSNAMAAEAVQGGDSGLMGQAQELQAFEQNPEYKKTLITARNNPLAQEKFDQAKKQATIQNFAAFTKKLDPTLQVRSPFGRAALAIQGANKIETLIGDAATNLKAANALPPNMVNELAMGLAAQIKGGVATESEFKKLAPNTRGMDEAQLKQYLTNELQGANAGQWVQLYAKTIQRERAESQIEVENTVMQQARGNFTLYHEDPELFKNTVANAMGVNTEDVLIDEKKKTVTTRQRLETDDKVTRYQAGIKEAFLARQSSNPEKKKEAEEVLSRLGINPKESLKKAMEDIKFRITRGNL